MAFILLLESYLVEAAGQPLQTYCAMKTFKVTYEFSYTLHFVEKVKYVTFYIDNNHK